MRPATEEEIAAGVWYPDMAAYRRAQGGDFTFTDREKTNGSQGSVAGSDG